MNDFRAFRRKRRGEGEGESTGKSAGQEKMKGMCRRK